MSTIIVYYRNLLKRGQADTIAKSLETILEETSEIDVFWKVNQSYDFVIHVIANRHILESVVWGDINVILASTAEYVNTTQTIQCIVKNGNGFTLSRAVQGMKE